MNIKPLLSFVSSFTPSFTPSNTFALNAAAISSQCSTKYPNQAMTRMVAPKHVRRTEEIERLTKQLEELRARREEILTNTNKPKTSSPSMSDVPLPPSSSSPPVSPSVSAVETSFHLGKHAEGSRFLSISSVDSEEYHPRILLIAGSVPGLTTDQFKKVPQILYSKKPAKGNLFLSRLPDGYTGDFISMPTFSVLAKCGDPVVLLVEPLQLSASKLPSSPNDDVAVVVDRDISDYPFKRNEFYVWDVNGKVQIGWSDVEPASDVATRIGKVVFGHVEIERQLRSKKSCWEEENETYT